jgi:hypothetical protein
MRFLLASLVALDLTLAITGFFFPSFWFSLFHAAPYVDPQGLLPRTAASWLAFAIVQTVALVRYEKQPHWLYVVAGLRLGDVLTDWTYIAACAHLTPIGWVLLGVASPGNALAAWYLMRRKS